MHSVFQNEGEKWGDLYFLSYPGSGKDLLKEIYPSFFLVDTEALEGYRRDLLRWIAESLIEDVERDWRGWRIWSEDDIERARAFKDAYHSPAARAARRQPRSGSAQDATAQPNVDSATSSAHPNGELSARITPLRKHWHVNTKRRKAM